MIQQNFAQHCSSEQPEQVDANSISMEKCKAGDTDNDDTTSSKDFSLNNRYLKRRKGTTSKNLLADINEGKNPNQSVESVELVNIKQNINSLASSIMKTSEESAIPFSEVDNVPLFTEFDEDSEDPYNSFNIKMQEHINDYFNYPEEALENKMEGTVLVSFVIDANGNITNIKTISPQNTEILKKEAVRIVSILPKFIPGKQDGKNVNVTYSFPMVFKIDSSN
ncbi:energy transducer TonB [Tenacibaculum xiamenense]|uniref:energy transducer TonB n=1 Tax=Tenacibaculum xiamenense TaxID=1261553 RepID=UPI0038B44A69